ncbi:atrial natriuretic peptide receptor 1-like [Mercenaria mercenaria]|uniref:atrial natriuretic peptide receptor 1-like n=1 Tax=Mercenaria mercenaria TaxID=6596 RepID=UPI00234F7BAF|nr:atrial natriuretic peptide receptor 1-like [Mercenaria mercenaria]
MAGFFHANIVWKDTRLQSDGVGNVVDLVMNENVDVIFGSPSSRVTIPAAHLTSHWNFPHISWAANSYDLSDKTLFTTFVRTIGPLSETGKSLVTLFKIFDWSRIGLLYIDYGLCLYSATGIKTQFAEANLTIIQSIAYPYNTIINDVVIDEYLKHIKGTSRIIFICVDGDLRRFMIRAYKNGMCNGDYLFIYTGLDTPTISVWKNGDSDDPIAKKAFRYLLYITTAMWVGDDGKKRLEEFNIEVIERMSEPPWNSTYAKDNGIEAGSGAQNLYEAMYLYGLWLNYSSENNISKRNGRELLKFTKDLSFPGISGPCDMGLTGDRIPYFWIYQFVGDNSELEIVALSETKVKKITEIGRFKWYTSDGRPPKDIPICGYFNEYCREHETDNTVVIVVVCMCVIILAALAVASGFIVRRRKMEEELLYSVWKVKVDDVELQKSKVGFGSRMNMKSLTAIQESAKDSESHRSSRSMNDMNVNAEVLMTTVALFKGQTVCVRTVRKQSVIAKEDLYSLKTMREMMHENINPFLGACFDTPSPFMLFLYCPKGSLQDVLENDEIKLDATFKYSLTMDLVQGMIYIHNSKLSVHGRLKSSNCLVDNRWMLKITDFGLDRFLDHNEQDSTEDHQKYKGMLWTAPELLENSSRIKTKEADVYSFGIILHEIFYRMGTFAGISHMTAKDIVGRVKNRENDPCRPELFTDIQEVSPEVIKLMQLCWLDNENERPSFNIIKSFIKKNIQHGKSSNIVDIMLNRLEKYASNLEELVDQRTQQLMQEKQKTDKLLYRMLPRSCADKLKLGENVLPELYEAATVFFSDIVGFTTLASKSSPMQVVDLLNDLYTCFDDIISSYDAYKVETIGDAYLVVSGIPTRNGDLHAGIIADMSIDMIAATGKFKIKHLPDEEVQVRIGMHTGPCCAGVVGLSMPRYCLFGDTVNTASRMESNGSANKIHLSETAHKALHLLGGYETSFRAEIPIKGKGLMRTYWLESSPNKG